MAFASDKSRQGAAGVSTGYEIDNSLRFNDNDSAYLSRTPSSAGNRKTWTWSGWVKRSAMTGNHTLFCSRALSTSTPYFYFSFNTTTNIFSINSDSGHFYTTQVFRDPSAWMHIVVAVDTTQGTNTNRIKLYINGSQVTDTSTVNYPSQNTDLAINHTILHQHCAVTNGAGSRSQYFDGYLAEVNFIDGTAELPSAFGESGDYGEWKPKSFSGTYGTNGFYLDFKLSAATSSGLGNDASSNSNNWTPTNLASTDQMLDTPTNNFCTMNPLEPSANGTYSEGNLRIQTVNYPFGKGTFHVSAGKWYWEWTHHSGTYNTYTGIGNDLRVAVNESHYVANTQAWLGNDAALKKWSSTSGYDAGTLAINDIIGIAVDLDNGSIKFYINNTLVGTDNTLPAGTTVTPLLGGSNDGTSGSGWGNITFNFGQDSSFSGFKTAQGNQDGNDIGDFYYTPPTGYLALCTSNLPAVAVVPSEHFNTVLYTGNISTNAITGVGFQPDLNWIKCRSIGYNNVLNDVLRGTGDLFSDTTAVELDYESVSLQSDGFTLSGTNRVNANTDTFVAWNWKANGTGASNTNGTITSTVSANVDAGFSIVSYTGNGTGGATVGHGLSQTPAIAITKNRTTASNWAVIHTPNGAKRYLLLNTIAAYGIASQKVGDATTLELWSDVTNNSAGDSYISYAFHSVDGYSKVGSYTGNGSTDGTFVYTGFRPAFVMVKMTSGTQRWGMTDSARATSNPNFNTLYAEDNIAEYTGTAHDRDYLSNGFKLRNTDGIFNTSGSTYIYLAFAEQPFKHSNAR